MSRSLSTPTAKGVGILDVPVEVAGELAVRYGDSIWKLLSRNQRAKLSRGEAGRQLVRSTINETNLDGVMLGMREDVPGLRSALAGEVAAPEWLAKWMVDEGWMSEEQQLVFVSVDRSASMRRWLRTEADLCPKAQAILALEGEEEGSYTWRQWEEVVGISQIMNGIVSDNERQENRRWKLSGEGLREQIIKEFDEQAEYGRRVLGDGTSEDSLAARERFFDLVESEVCDNLCSLMHGAQLVVAGT